MAKSKFQIREREFGLALYEAESAREALLAFVADRAKAESRPFVEVREDGTAAIFDGLTEYRAVEVTT